MRAELEGAVGTKMILFHQRHEESICIITRRVKRNVIEMRVSQSLDMDAV